MLRLSHRDVIPMLVAGFVDDGPSSYGPVALILHLFLVLLLPFTTFRADTTNQRRLAHATVHCSSRQEPFPTPASLVCHCCTSCLHSCTIAHVSNDSVCMRQRTS
jgi:hypothetical protein